MIDYATFQRIQHLHRVEQLTAAQIALAMAMDARTVRRWLDEPQFRARATPARPEQARPLQGLYPPTARAPTPTAPHRSSTACARPATSAAPPSSRT